MPARALRLAQAVAARMAESRFGLIAAGVAFYAMFAVFPGLSATVALWSLMADPAAVEASLLVAEEFLPADAAALIHDQVMGLVTTSGSTLGWATALSLAVALYSARAGVSALIQGLDVVHRATPRPLVRGWLVEGALTLALILALMVALATTVVVPVALAWVPLGPVEGWLLSVLPWGAMFALVLTCIGLLFRFGPNVAGDRAPFVTPGTLFAALAWAGVALAFSAYLANFNSYNRIYGSIGAVAALLMWLYLSVWAVLMGAAINAELGERVSAKGG